MIRGGLISLLYGKTADLPINAVQPEASLTLMNADIERISNGFQFAHDLWANIIEMALATYLLERQLGPSAAIPVGVAVRKLCFPST